MPLLELPGRFGTPLPAHTDNEVPKLNVGVILGVTVTLNVVFVAHCPAEGVKVYVPEILSSTTEGVHSPLMLFVDVFGNVGTTSPAQIFNDVPKLNAGTILGVTVTVNVVVVAHKPAVGVNVYTPEL